MSYLVRLARIATSVALPALLLAACESGRHASGEPTGAGSRPASASFSISYPPCHASDLRGEVVADSPADHGLQWTLTLTNMTVNTCQTRGWVGLDAVSIVGNTATAGLLKADQIGNAVDVVIRPNESAYSIITRTSTDEEHCIGHLILDVTPPGADDNDDPVFVDLPNGSLCSGHVTVTALASGTGPGS